MRRVLIFAVWVGLAFPGMSLAQSSRQAFWRSLLIPGWGQHYAGRHAGAMRFLTAELALWGGYFTFRRLGDIREDNFRSYAAVRAQAQPEGKNRRFFDALGFYDSQRQHNLVAQYADGPKAHLYPEGAEFFWEWDREEARLRYRELRNASLHARRRALYVTGGLVVNRLLASIDAGRRAEAGVRIGFDPGSGQLEAVLVRGF